MGGYVTKVHVSAYQTQGEPDLDCCYQGLWVSFELKVGTNKASALQNARMESIRKAGGIAKTVHSLQEIKETLHEISRVQQKGKPER